MVPHLHRLLQSEANVIVLLLVILMTGPRHGSVSAEEGTACGDHAVCSAARREVCVATMGTTDNGTAATMATSEECSAHKKYFETCQVLSCARGMSCRVLKREGRPAQVHVGCVYPSRELDRFAARHGSSRAYEKDPLDDMVPSEDDTPIAWCIVISVLSLLPLIVLACIVIYRFVYKLPRIGREKEELTRLFQTLGYDENTEIYKKVIEFFYK